MKTQEKTKEQLIKELQDLRKQLTDLKKAKNRYEQAEEGLEQLRRRNDLILSSAGEGIYGLDQNGLTTFVNPAAARMLGWRPEELHGKPQHAVIHHTRPDGKPYPRDECPIYAAFKDGKVHLINNEVFWKKDGTSFPVEYTSTPIRDERGRLEGAVVTFRDITKRKQAEEVIRRANRNLEAKLVEIKELSQKTLQQEVERTKLEAENARKTHELEEARKLQLSMLPKTVPALPNLDIAVYMQTATEVGGDYYDFKLHEDGTLTAVIGDATGHGLQAGTMVSATKSLFNALVDDPDPVRILKKGTMALNDMHLKKMFMALTVAKIRNNQMQIAAAGMPFALVYRLDSRRVEEVELKGMPLGSVRYFNYQQEELDLKKGDTVLLMSDGFPEMFNEQNEELGEEQVKTLFQEAAEKPPEQIIEHLVEAGKKWANGQDQKDDVTFMIIRFKT